MAKRTHDYGIDVRHRKNGYWEVIEGGLTKKQSTKLFRELVKDLKDDEINRDIKEVRRVKIVSVPIGKIWRRGK